MSLLLTQIVHFITSRLCSHSKLRQQQCSLFAAKVCNRCPSQLVTTIGVQLFSLIVTTSTHAFVGALTPGKTEVIQGATRGYLRLILEEIMCLMSE